MSVRDLLPRISGALAPGEDPNDVGTMIELLAGVRATALGTSPQEQFTRAGEFICVAPVKPPGYRRAAVQARARFRGIARDPRLRHAFLKDLNEAPFGWLMSAALSGDARVRLQRPAAVPTLADLVRDVEGEDEPEPPELLLG